MNARNIVYHTPLPQGTTLLNGKLFLDSHKVDPNAHAGVLLPLVGGNLTGPITVPKATAVNQVAPITKRDGQVGVLEINGMPLVHTPEQIILSWTGGVQDSANQFGTIDTTQYALTGTGSVRLQRIGPMVRLTFPNGSTGAITKLSSGVTYLLTGGATGPSLPSGYTSTNQARHDGYANTLRCTLIMTSTGGRLGFQTSTDGTNEALFRGRWEWFTSDPPPTSIIGVTVGGTGVNI